MGFGKARVAVSRAASKPMRPRGFTLLELMVALFIAAVMFALGYSALIQVADQRTNIAQARSELDDLRRAVRILSLDIDEMLARPIRDPVGTGRIPALYAEPRDGVIFSLTRSAVGLPGASAAVRRIEYRLEDRRLLRDAWPVLDRTAQGQALRRVVLEDVESLSLRYLRADGQWQNQWSPSEPRERPLAVEITLETEDFGLISRLIEVP